MLHLHNVWLSIVFWDKNIGLKDNLIFYNFLFLML